MSIHNMAAWMIDAFGSDAQRQQWLPKLCTMELLASYCLTPRARRRFRRRRPRPRARVHDGDHYVLNGQKQFISGAGAGGPLRRDGADGRPGTRRNFDAGCARRYARSFARRQRAARWAGSAQPTRAYNLQDARVPVANRLGEEGIGFKIAMAGLDGGRLNIAACSLGGAQSALDKHPRLHEGAQGLRQTARRIPSVAIPHCRHGDRARGLAHILVACRGGTRCAREPNATTLCAMAKRFVTDACFDVANQALQLHGGYGYLSGGFGIERDPCAICACIRSSKERTRSCASS